MLKCSCGHENFPLTSAYNYGYDSTVRIVEFCHQCGARITEECPVCSRLHPLNTAMCSVYGLSIEAFREHMVGLETRAKIFRELPEMMEIMRVWASRVLNFKIAYFGILGLMISGFVSMFIATRELSGFIFVLGLIALLITTFFLLVIISTTSLRAGALWREKNPGVMEPGSIKVNSNSVRVNFNIDREHYSVTFQSRLRSFLLNQTS